ncbi:MAG: RNHCP domain-containing protein [bacterium]|nr:RNHCP domain-containing protein [bacterium]
MSRERKNFIVRNEGFICTECDFENDPAKTGCRNHCRKCLTSLHVDNTVPGDRESICRGKMKPVSLDQHGKKGQMIVHRCLTCGKNIRNMVAPDDDLDAIIRLMPQP